MVRLSKPVTLILLAAAAVSLYYSLVLMLSKEGASDEEPIAENSQTFKSKGVSTSSTHGIITAVEGSSRPSTNPFSILYLTQTEQCLPGYLKRKHVLGNKNEGFEIIVLSYKKRCNDTSLPHVEYLWDPFTSWTTGRNVLLEAAMKRNKTYLYYVFMDDDFSMYSRTNLPGGPWRRFESSLRAYEPAIAAVDEGWIPHIRKYHVNKQCSGETAEFIGTVWFDAICNAFHYKAIEYILPYDSTFDQRTWWASQMSVIIRSEVLFRGQVVIHRDLYGKNPRHRSYPRGLNFTSQMIHHMTEGLEKLVPEDRAECANATIQQWRTKKLLDHGVNSSTLCIEPPPYHDTISPGRYACSCMLEWQ